MQRRFSIVSAVYNVAKYLPEFIASIEAQTFDLGRLQVVMVDDGSTDESLALLHDWQRRRPELVTVLTKPNGGQASARNLGMDAASGEWVAFTDPDDMLERDYLTEVDAFLAENPTTEMVATKRVVLLEATGERIDHPLSVHFTRRNRLRNLNYDTGHFHGHAPCAFFRLEVLRREQLRFDARIRPSFEDGHFCCTYLLRVAAPMVGFVQSAVYVYRKRADRTSTLDLSWLDPGRYTTVPELGYLALLHDAKDRTGGVPPWLQGMILYELQWYFRTEDAIPAIENCARGEVAHRFNELLAEITTLLDPEFVLGFSSRRMTAVHRDVLLHSFRDEPWHTPFFIVDKIDMKQRTMRLTYRYTGRPPDAQLFVDGELAAPLHDKIRDVRYFDRTTLHERIVWLPFGTARVVFDGTQVADARMVEPVGPTHYLDSWTMRVRMDPATQRQEAAAAASRLNPADVATVRLAASRPVRKLFRNSWVLIDRVHNADDSAEHLFRWLRAHQPKVNAWFVVEADTPDYERLRAEGYGRRLVAYGSLRWKLLMLNAQHLISSHADVPILNPVPLRGLVGTPTWRTTFLQHGVTKDDLSNWLNPKNFDLFVVSTPAEYESVAGDHNAYAYTGRETVLTGLPRFDKVLEAGNRFPPDRRDYILLAPTWREWLAQQNPTTLRRTIDPQEFRDSDFAQNWRAVLASDELKTLAERLGLTVAVLLHPDLQSAKEHLDVPPHVRLLSFEGDIREHFARARLLATDYSSMSFNAAYIERPVVYFQFDRDRVLGGGHLGRPGYFDYDRDGFGPVVSTPADAIKVIVEGVESGPEPAAEYLARIRAAFPQRDGRCCERAYEAIRDSTKRVRRPDSRSASGGDLGVDLGVGGGTDGADADGVTADESPEDVVDDVAAERSDAARRAAFGNESGAEASVDFDN